MVFAPTPDASAAFRELRGRWVWFVALGAFMLAAGVIALFSVVMATIVSVLWVGAMMVVSGAFEIVHGFQMKRWSRFFLWVAIGVLYAIAGIIAFTNPVLAAGILTLLLGFALIFAGVVRIVLAMQMRTGSAWGLVTLSGAITLLLGAIIVLGWPVSGLYTLGIFLGVDLIFAGVSWLAAGFALRRLA